LAPLRKTKQPRRLEKSKENTARIIAMMEMSFSFAFCSFRTLICAKMRGLVDEEPPEPPTGRPFAASTASRRLDSC
jgi:hypothetical protein